MELYGQYASYPFQEWLSERRGDPPLWETLQLPTAHEMMDYDLQLLSAHSDCSFAGESPVVVDNFLLSSGSDGLSQTLHHHLDKNDGYYHLTDQFQAQHITDDVASYSPYGTEAGGIFPVYVDSYAVSSMVEEEVLCDDFEASMEILGACKMEPVYSPEYQPVPMDRTSILGDTIDYMKELLEKIHKLKDELDLGPNLFKVVQPHEDDKQKDIPVRSSPKFHVERRNEDTRVEICCSARPGLLLSTVNTLEALGLEIQQCIISCFNDFALQASCSEEQGQRSMATPQDMEQALFKNAGYGGRCLSTTSTFFWFSPFLKHSPEEGDVTFP
ncbi:hypothetical protein SAY86_013447 [Trapa natans]|uniref:Plant bHLH transcription factor ACT-like domain-containing protein n=1 Tax=Trapa natans TaxID=22666 RepID=A0AAN7RFD1_TRANT|nr:hypothetical protein SAY86_013447 [Trapa natans]